MDIELAGVRARSAAVRLSARSHVLHLRPAGRRVAPVQSEASGHLGRSRRHHAAPRRQAARTKSTVRPAQGLRRDRSAARAGAGAHGRGRREDRLRRAGRRCRQRLEREIDAKAREIYDKCGFEFNINSPKQLGDVLFNRLNLPKPMKYGKGKTISTAVDVLEGLGRRTRGAAAWCSNTASSPS